MEEKEVTPIERVASAISEATRLLNEIEFEREPNKGRLCTNAKVAMDLMASYNEPTSTGYTVVHKSTLIQAAHSIVSLEYELCTAKNSVEELQQVNKYLHSRIAELRKTNERLQDSVISLTPDSMK